MGTDPLEATLKHVNLPIILNNQLNLNVSQTIAVLAISTTVLSDHFGPFLIISADYSLPLILIWQMMFGDMNMILPILYLFMLKNKAGKERCREN